MTLPEILVATLLASGLAAMAHGFTLSALEVVRAQDLRREAAQNLLLAADAMAREIRAAGFHASGDPLPAILTATAERIDVQADLDGDGSTTGANERLSFSHDASRRSLMRASGSGSPQPFLRGLAVEGFRLRFFGRDGEELLPPAGGLGEADRARVRRLVVTLQLDPAWLGDRRAYRGATSNLTIVVRNPEEIPP